jgi:hypothetical protein
MAQQPTAAAPPGRVIRIRQADVTKSMERFSLGERPSDKQIRAFIEAVRGKQEMYGWPETGESYAGIIDLVPTTVQKICGKTDKTLTVLLKTLQSLSLEVYSETPGYQTTELHRELADIDPLQFATCAGLGMAMRAAYLSFPYAKVNEATLINMFMSKMEGKLTKSIVDKKFQSLEECVEAVKIQESDIKATEEMGMKVFGRVRGICSIENMSSPLKSPQKRQYEPLFDGETRYSPSKRLYGQTREDIGTGQQETRGEWEVQQLEEQVREKGVHMQKERLKRKLYDMEEQGETEAKEERRAKEDRSTGGRVSAVTPIQAPDEDEAKRRAQLEIREELLAVREKAVQHRIAALSRELPEVIETVAKGAPCMCPNCGKAQHEGVDCCTTRWTNDVQQRYGVQEDRARSFLSGSSQMTCFNCGGKGHMARNCDKPRARQDIICFKCDQPGHFARDCGSRDGNRGERRRGGYQGRRDQDRGNQRDQDRGYQDRGNQRDQDRGYQDRGNQRDGRQGDQRREASGVNAAPINHDASVHRENSVLKQELEAARVVQLQEKVKWEKILTGLAGGDSSGTTQLPPFPPPS